MSQSMLSPMEREAIEWWCEDNDLSFRPSYSGRGMYGRTCFGITGDDHPAAITARLAMHLQAEGYDALAEAIAASPSTDNMGRGVIVYWPHFHCPTEDEMQEES